MPRGVPVAIAENPTDPPLACGDVVLFGLGQRVLRRAAGSASAVTWAEVCSPSWGAGTIRPELNAKPSVAGQGGYDSRWLCVVTGGARDVMDRPYL